MSLIQMSFSGAVLILAIVILRAALINRLPKKTFVILWEIALLRLLLPFSIPSMFSAYSFMNQNQPVRNALTDTPAGSMIPIAGTRQFDISRGTAQPLSHGVSSVSIWFILWCAGMILCAVFFIASYLRFLWRFQASLPVDNDLVSQWLEGHPLKRPITVRQSSMISAPLTYGIFRPVILIPKKTDWENTSQLQYVLLHEYVHICRFDAVIKLILTAALCIHWFNPLIWVMYLLFNRDIELACDERVVLEFGENSKSAYALTLISMEEKKSLATPLCNNFSKSAIEERITAIMKTKKRTLWALVISAAVLILIVAVFATSADKEAVSHVIYRDRVSQIHAFIPSNWSYDLLEQQAGDTAAEMPSDVGLRIYMDEQKENLIEIVRQEGHAAIPAQDKGIHYQLNDDLDGVLYEESSDGAKQLLIVLNPDSYLVRIRADEKIYRSCEDKISKLLRSVAIIDNRLFTYAALVKAITKDTITVDMVEFITDDDTDRIKELNLTENDMPDGYYIYNPSMETTQWKLTDDTTYTFIDWSGEFSGADYPEEFITRDGAIFRKWMKSYPDLPFFFDVENGVVKSILEKPFA